MTRRLAIEAVREHLATGHKGTVADLSKALGYSEERVQAALHSLRTDSLAARLDVVERFDKDGRRSKDADLWGAPPPVPAAPVGIVQNALRQRSPIETAWFNRSHS